MNAFDTPLGREVAYPKHYDPGLLFPIPRVQARSEIGIDEKALPFIGHDRWHAYELSWLDARGKPVMATATLEVPADSPNLIESKSLKLYMNSLNASRFSSTEEVWLVIATDLSRVAGAQVVVQPGLPEIAKNEAGIDLDQLDISIGDYGPPNPAHLRTESAAIAECVLHSSLLKSNCPVTGQPDWASVHIGYVGPRIDSAGLLRYLVSFRDHAEFHEQCVERIFVDVMRYCRPQQLAVEARYTRRGGLDINPSRATPGMALLSPRRDPRQ